MTGLFIFVHTVAAVLLIAVILMQSGRGGGLTEGFASAESMFGAKTNEFMVRATTILTCVFLITSVTLARLSSKKEQSLIPTTPVAENVIELDVGQEEPALPTEEAAVATPEAKEE